MSVSDESIIKRDEIVLKMAQKYKVPIVMVPSGGHQKKNARVISNSTKSLKLKSLLDLLSR